MVLPFENVCQLVEYFKDMLETNQQVELCVRSLLFLLKLYEVGFEGECSNG